MNREKIIQACKDAYACESGFKKLVSAKSNKDFVMVLYDNLEWCLNYLPEEIISDIDWDFKKFTNIDMVHLISKYPKFSKYCDWKKLNGYDWSNLLKKQLQFAKYCDWDKLNKWDWSFLLMSQPQLKKYKK